MKGMNNMDFIIGVIQPPYPESKKGIKPIDVMNYMLKQIKKIDDKYDLIVLPEYSNCPGINVKDEMEYFIEQNSERFIKRLCELAIHKKVNIAVNVVLKGNVGYENTTLLINADGKKEVSYPKTHLSYSEINILDLSSGQKSTVFNLGNVRISFFTCFEVYFAEYIEKIASFRPDVVIFPSYQRSENSDVIRKQTMGRALDLEAFIIRASYSMGPRSKKGGCSLVVKPNGEIIVDAGQRTGLFTCTINPKKKRPRPIAHGLQKAISRQIIEDFRKPNLYRFAGPGIGRKELVSYPRVIAHRGLSGLCPENTIPAFSAAIGLGAQEIEFDVAYSRDGELVICHDPTVNRTSNGKGLISRFSWEKISKFDAGSWFGKNWTNVPFCRLQDIFEQFAGRVVMNIHVQAPGENGWVIYKIKELASQYGIVDQIYIAGEKDVLEWALRIAPEVDRCCFIASPTRVTEVEDFEEAVPEDMRVYTPPELSPHVSRFQCKRVQIQSPHFNRELIDEAHHHGIICNLFYTDNKIEAEKCYRLGIDGILTKLSRINRVILSQEAPCGTLHRVS